MGVSRTLGGRRQKKAKPVKARTSGGVAVVIPPVDADSLLAELAALSEAVKRCHKHGLPLANLPSLLRA